MRATILLLLTIAGPAWADGPESEKSAEQDQAASENSGEEDKAHELFQAGNQLFVEQEYALALAKFEQALKLRDHPAIHHNVARCLIQLDRPRQALAHLETSLKYGADVLGEEQYASGLDLLKLLRGQLGTIVLATEQKGVRVALDGKELFVGPGRVTQTVEPGEHLVVAERAGFITRTEKVELFASTEEVVELELAPVLDTITFTRWPVWVPWTILGTGAALAAVSIPVQIKSRSHFDDFDRGLSACEAPGCLRDDLPPELGDLKSKAETQQRNAAIFASIGGAMAATGVVLLVLNRQQTSQQPREAIAVSGGLGNVSVSIRF